MGAAKKVVVVLAILILATITVSYFGRGTPLGFIYEIISRIVPWVPGSSTLLTVEGFRESSCHVEGTVRNLLNTGASNVAVKVDYLDKHSFVIGTEYVDVGYIDPLGEKDFSKDVCGPYHDRISYSAIVR